ncbi:hypothetical protein ElyMa_001091300 [Elysia marginata]|uniref:Uncharacterized protein n=1 Tax=Elysia marginata TaxID=1093978 RepID=A0AAV4HUZ6_9GAST|nr:hypothetical protein ElyMa_001091300 [Elysia marginata]
MVDVTVNRTDMKETVTLSRGRYNGTPWTFSRQLPLYDQSRSVLGIRTSTSENKDTTSMDQLCGLAQRSGGAWFDPRPSQTKDFKIGILAADPSSAWHYGFSAKSGGPGVRIM